MVRRHVSGRASAPPRWAAVAVLALAVAASSPTLAGPAPAPAASLPVGTAPLPAAAAPAEVLRAGGVEAGLCVHLGATDGALEAEWARTGRRLVHGLALDDAAVGRARQAIAAAGLAGLATVERAADLRTLPYAEHLVNLLAADLDALGARAPPEAEVLRVLAPEGVALVRRGGAWTRTVKPRPSEMDDWTHFDYGPEGNGVSRDRLVRPATFVQWAVGVQEVRLGGNPAGFRVYTGPRVAGGRVFFEWGTADKNRREAFYDGRDAFNGLLLWRAATTAAGRKDWQFVAAKDRLYAFLEKGGPLVALDAATGRVLRTYDQGGRLTDEWRQTALRHCEGTLLLACADTLYALDAASGALKWKHAEPGAGLVAPCAGAKAGRVYVAVAQTPTRGSSRWPVARTEAVLALDLATGRPVWRCDAMKGFYVGQLVPADGVLAVFASGAIGGGDEPFIGALDLADGRLLWHRTFKKEYNRFGYNMLVRDGTLYYADAWRIYAHDLRTGDETRPFDDSGYNMRCNRFSATPDYFLYGLVAYVDRQWQGVFQSITRAGCALGAVPAHGLTYFTPNACGCITQVRGHLALGSEPVRPAVPDAARLETAFAGREGVARPGEAPAAAAEGPVAGDWLRQARAPQRETAPVEADGRTVVAVVHEHRVEARDGAGKVLWAFTAGGRISAPPVVHEGLCLFGSHDGWVYAVHAADGTPAWRFLAAPYERRVVAYGQLESSWPVYGVVMHKGLVCASAGVHPEVGGGIYVYGLEPKTGRVAWRKVLARAPVRHDGRSRASIRPNRVLGDVLQADGDVLRLPGIALDPREPDAETQQKVDNPVPEAKAKKG